MKATIIFKDATMGSEEIEGGNLYVMTEDGIVTLMDEQDQRAIVPVSELIAIFIE